MNLTHKVLRIQDGIQRLSLEKVLAIHFLHLNATQHSVTKMKRRVYAITCCDGSVCPQKLPRIFEGKS